MQGGVRKVTNLCELVQNQHAWNSMLMKDCGTELTLQYSAPKASAESIWEAFPCSSLS